MQPSERNRQLNKDGFESLSIPGYVMKKNQSRGPSHGQSMPQVMYHKARDMLRKAKTSKEWFVRDYSGKMGHRCSLAKVIVWWRLDRRENQTVRSTCLGRPFLWSYTCRKGTMAKKLENVLNKEGKEGKIRQRPDFREAKHTYRWLYKEHVESTGQGSKSIHPAQQRWQNFQQQFDEHEEYAYMVHPRTGWIYYSSTIFRLHLRSGSRTMNGSRNKVGIIGDLQRGLNSNNF